MLRWLCSVCAVISLLVVCGRSSSVPSNGSLPCGYSMNGINVDFSALNLCCGADYTINTGDTKYKMNVCNFDGNCLASGASICSFYLTTPVPLGFWPPYPDGNVTSFTPIDPNNLYGGLRLDFSNAFCKGAAQTLYTSVDFLCGQNTKVPFALSYADPSGCAYNFTFTTETACGRVSVLNFTCPPVTVADQVTTCTIQALDAQLNPVKTSLINLTSIQVVQGDFTFLLPTPAFGDTFKLHFIPVSTTVQFQISLPGLFPVSSGIITVKQPLALDLDTNGLDIPKDVDEGVRETDAKVAINEQFDGTIRILE